MRRHANHEASGRDLLGRVYDIPADAAEPVADLLDGISEELRHRADVHRTQAKMRRETKRDLMKLNAIPLSLLGSLADGRNFEEAARIATDGGKVRLETIYHYWLEFIRKLQEKHRARRADRIMKLRAAGQTNDQIAQAEGLSSRQVGRVIRQRLTGKRDTR